MFKYAVTIETTFASKTAIDPKVLKGAKKTLARCTPETIVVDAGLDDLIVTCGKATVTIE